MTGRGPANIAGMACELLEAGLLKVVYATDEDMQPKAQRVVADAVAAELRKGPLGLLFVVPDIPRLDTAVPAYWLEVVSKSAPRLCAMAIASRSMLIRTAATSFGVTLKLRRIKHAVKAFEVYDPALEWVRAELRAARVAEQV